jgi:hypothetical protein
VKKKWQTFLTSLGQREGMIFFGAALCIYTLTRFLYLEDFPIYFFTDEAAQQVRARALWDNLFFDEHGYFLPVTTAGPWFRFVSLAHYIQLPAWLIFGNTIYAVRGTSALLTLGGVWGLSLILRRYFDCKIWWLTPLVMLTMPAWFLHSRTAFECVYTVVFYIWFCYFYLGYLSGKLRDLYWAAAFGALTFYSYSAGPAVMAITSLLLLLSDINYHLQKIQTVSKAFALTCACLIPYGLFFIHYPESPAMHMEMYSTILTSNIPMGEKLKMILNSYLSGLTHHFWFEWERANIRHQIKDLAHLLPATAPFFYLGLGLTLFHIKKSSSRLVLILILASSTGAAFVKPEITRNLTFLVPACLLILTGTDFLIQRTPFRALRSGIPSVLFILLSLYSFSLTITCLKKSPFWFDLYTLHGLQWGSKQLVRDAIPEYLKQHPDETIYLATEWANSPDYITSFFNSPPNVHFDDINPYLETLQELPKGTFIITESQFQKIVQSKILEFRHTREVMCFPDGSRAFHFLKLRYAENASTLITEAVRERQQLSTGYVRTIDHQIWKVRHSLMDMGDIKMLFDGDKKQLARGGGGHPFIVEIDFPQNKVLHGVEVVFIQENNLTAIPKNEKGECLGTFSGKLKKTDPIFPLLRVGFPDLKQPVRSIRLEMREENKADFEAVIMHVKEITFY